MGQSCAKVVLLLVVLWAASACTTRAPSQSRGPTAAEPRSASAAATNTDDVLGATDLESLRRNHPVANEGATCTIDEDCDSPLRCLQGRCGFPAAMTGQHDRSTPRAVFFTEEGDHLFYLETALSMAEMMRGLMHRRTLAEQFGMVFLYGDERPRSFWMQNTLIPLDIIYIRSSGVIDSIAANAEPLTTTSRRSAGPAQYVIEIRGGLAASLGIRPGQRVELMNLSTDSSAP
jgi:uncharacterized membrane protein (UPF0127 family)